MTRNIIGSLERFSAKDCLSVHCRLLDLRFSSLIIYLRDCRRLDLVDPCLIGLKPHLPAHVPYALSNNGIEVIFDILIIPESQLWYLSLKC